MLSARMSMSVILDYTTVIPMLFVPTLMEATAVSASEGSTVMVGKIVQKLATKSVLMVIAVKRQITNASAILDGLGLIVEPIVVVTIIQLV